MSGRITSVVRRIAGATFQRLSSRGVQQLVFVFLVCFPSAAIGQDPHLEWGDVPIDHLRMTLYPPDSNAAALILFDRGEVHFNQDYHLIFRRHTRIKILTKTGFEWGTHKINYYSKDGTQRVEDIEGMTISLDVEGNVVRKELDDESIFIEEQDRGWDQVRFTLPALSAGCVVEFRYTIRSNSPHYLSDWEFQTSEPTLWSEYRIKTPQIFGYAGLSQGYEQFFINTNEQLKETFNTPNGPQIINVASARWVMKDVPAIRDEPFITTVDDYRAKVMFQLASVTWPGDRTRQILETWEKVAEELWEYSKFGDQLNQNGDVGKQAEFVTRGIEDSLQKAIALYDYVRNTVVWNKERRFTVDEDLDEVLESKTGSSAEINLLLTSMLRRAGLRANPVLLSTRNNGRIQKAYPILSQFDYVIASVKVGQRDYLLDATDRERPFHLLPQRVLNHHGLSIDGGRCSWTAIEPSAKARSATVATLELDNEGLLKGLIRRAFFDYSAFVQRQDLSGKQADDYVRSLLRSETTGLSVDSFAIHNKESVRDSLVVEAWVSSPTVSQVLDNFIYMNPHFLDRTSENPLKLTKRNFPVDFAYLKESSCTLRLTLPGGYELKECPKDRSVQLPSNGGTYKRRAQCSEGTFQLLTRYELNKTVFEPAQYRALRAFYDQMVITESEQIVLQMKHSNDRVK